MSPRHFVEVRTTHGGPAPSETGRAIAESKRRAGRGPRRVAGATRTPRRARRRRWTSEVKRAMTDMQRTYVRVVIVWVVTLAAAVRVSVVLHPLTTCLDEPHRLACHRLSRLDRLGRHPAEPQHRQSSKATSLASNSLPWWAVGLSVMATQLSAITMVSSTGQGYADGMGLLQQYYALPIAMIIIAVTFVPFFHNANVYTAYEYLEGASMRRRARSPRCCSCSRAACRRAWSSPRRRSCCR